VVRNSEAGESCPRAVMPVRSPFAGGFIQVFLVFSQIGLSSFGGSVAAWMHREFVERRGWLEESEFATALAVARILPGVNIVNLAVLIGQRLKGLIGVAAAVAGLLTGPILVVIGLGFLYQRFAGMVDDTAAGCDSHADKQTDRGGSDAFEHVLKKHRKESPVAVARSRARVQLRCWPQRLSLLLSCAFRPC